MGGIRVPKLAFRTCFLAESPTEDPGFRWPKKPFFRPGTHSGTRPNPPPGPGSSPAGLDHGIGPARGSCPQPGQTAGPVGGKRDPTPRIWRPLIMPSGPWQTAGPLCGTRVPKLTFRTCFLAESPTEDPGFRWPRKPLFRPGTHSGTRPQPPPGPGSSLTGLDHGIGPARGSCSQPGQTAGPAGGKRGPTPRIWRPLIMSSGP